MRYNGVGSMVKVKELIIVQGCVGAFCLIADKPLTRSWLCGANGEIETSKRKAPEGLFFVVHF